MFENSLSDLELDGSLTIRASSVTLNVSTDNNLATMGENMLLYFFLLLGFSSYFSI